MLDVHCHLYPPLFPNAEEILEEMKEKNIHCIAVSEDIHGFDQVMQLSKKYRHLIPFVGIHPVQKHGSVTIQDYEDSVGKLRYLLGNGAKGIGEIGLDFSPHKRCFANEVALESISQLGYNSIHIYLKSSSISAAIAGAISNPIDVVKCRVQGYPKYAFKKLVLPKGDSVSQLFMIKTREKIVGLAVGQVIQTFFSKSARTRV